VDCQTAFLANWPATEAAPILAAYERASQLVGSPGLPPDRVLLVYTLFDLRHHGAGPSRPSDLYPGLARLLETRQLTALPKSGTNLCASVVVMQYLWRLIREYRLDTIYIGGGPLTSSIRHSVCRLRERLPANIRLALVRSLCASRLSNGRPMCSACLALYMESGEPRHCPSCGLDSRCQSADQQAMEAVQAAGVHVVESLSAWELLVD
ncbi:hypothetical protein BOX15_Mlig017384g1, partial [Macrostomum lignano]